MLKDLFIVYPHLLFQGTAIICSVLLVSVIVARLKRRGALPFGLLATTLIVWQSGKLIKNLSLVAPLQVDISYWSSVSFAGATFIYSTFFHLATRISFRDRGPLVWLAGLGYISSAVFILLDIQGLLHENLVPTEYGYFKQVTPLYFAYLVNFFLFIGMGLAILFPRDIPKIPQLRNQLAAIFTASVLGYSLGALEFFGNYGHPVYPIADLSPLVFGGVLYWAIFRFNLWGAGQIFRYLLAAVAYFAGITLVLFGINWVSLQISLRFTQNVELGPLVLLDAVQVAMLTPLAFYITSLLRKRFFPVRHSYRKLFLTFSSRLSDIHLPERMIELALAEMSREFGFQLPRGYLFTFGRGGFDHTQVKGIGAPSKLPITSDDIRKISNSGMISRRTILAELRLGAMREPEKHGKLMDLRRLNRLEADLVLPVCSQGQLVGLLLFQEKNYRMEEWETAAEVLASLSEILGNHIYQTLLIRQRSEQEHLSKVGMMSASMAHEIKNPLEGIYGAAQILRDQGEGNPKFIEMILKDSERLNEVVHQFLAFARPFRVQPSEFDVIEFLREFVEEQNSIASREKVALKSDVEHMSLQSDQQAIKQILLNLVQNAHRYQREGLPVMVKVSRFPQSLTIAVEDEGDGIPEEDRGRIFEPFFTTSSRGTGLGLAISKKIAQEMGGDLYFEPKIPGSRFVLELRWDWKVISDGTL